MNASAGQSNAINLHTKLISRTTFRTILSLASDNEFANEAVETKWVCSDREGQKTKKRHRERMSAEREQKLEEIRKKERLDCVDQIAV